jgi:hypothetical protein
MSRSLVLVLTAAALAASPVVASAQQPDPPCKVMGGPHLEYHDGMPVIVMQPYQPVCY